MSQRTAMPCVLLSALLVTTAPVAWAQEEDELTFDDADLFFELNDTDGDLGIQSTIDGEAWRQLEIEDPDDRRLLDVVASSSLRRQGLTEINFESAEPTFDELAPEEFFERFPEGTYDIEARTLESEALEAEVDLTHLLPAPPDNVTIAGEDAVEGCDDVDPPTISEGDAVIDWDPVEVSHPEIGRTNEPIDVTLYQVFVEYDREDDEPSELVYQFDVPPDVTSVTVSADIIQLAGEFEGSKFEIITREASGNLTSIESCFEVE